MNFEYTPEQEVFCQEVRRWLEANITPDLCVDDARGKEFCKTFYGLRGMCHI